MLLEAVRGVVGEAAIQKVGILSDMMTVQMTLPGTAIVVVPLLAISGDERREVSSLADGQV